MDIHDVGVAHCDLVHVCPSILLQSYTTLQRINNFILSSVHVGGQRNYSQPSQQNWERRPTYLGKNDDLHGITRLQGYRREGKTYRLNLQHRCGRIQRSAGTDQHNMPTEGTGRIWDDSVSSSRTGSQVLRRVPTVEPRSEIP
jgi:hypothetical protein